MGVVRLPPLKTRIETMQGLPSVGGRFAVVAMLLVAASCGNEENSTRPGDPNADQDPANIADKWGPLAIITGERSGDEALIGGTLDVTENCLLLDERGEPALLVWPARGTEWNPASGTVIFTNADGSAAELSAGDAVSFSGGGSSFGEGGASSLEFVASVEWVAEPHPDCVTDTRWFVGDLVGIE